MIGRYSKGSYLGATPSAPSVYSASGVWSLASAARYRVDDEWPPLLTPPGPPTIISPSWGFFSSDGLVTVQWLPPANAPVPVSGYRVEAYVLDNDAVQYYSVPSGTARQIQFARNLSIELRVQANSAAGYGDFSGKVYIRTGPNTVPSAPTITSITVS